MLTLFILTSTLLLASAEPVSLIFEVNPATVPGDSAVYVVGNIQALGQWRHEDALRLSQFEPGMWRGALEVAVGTEIAFKVTCGSWATEALLPDGSIPADTWITVISDSTLIISVDAWKHERERISGGVTGDVRRHTAFHSDIMGRGRDIWVLLPRSYADSTGKRYPVLYMHDGRNAFDPALSYAGVDWQVDEVVDSLSAKGKLPELMVVAIDNTPQRSMEYADTTLGELYAQFIVEELKPFIDEQYRTLPSRDHTAVMGSSMGGLISFLLAWWYPDVFGHAACLSPAFLWGDDKALRRVKEEQPPAARVRIYLDIGDQGIERELAPGTVRMAQLLQERGWMPDRELVCRRFPGSGHHESAWALRMDNVLRFLFLPALASGVQMKGVPCD